MARLVDWLKQFLRKYAESRAFRRIESCSYRAIPKKKPTKRAGVLLIASPGCGNIGDQAMFESFVGNTDGPITAILSQPDALSVPVGAKHRVETHVLPGLFQGRPQLTPRLIWKFGRLLQERKSLVIVGGDIVDGAYSFRQAWSCTQALRTARRLGLRLRVIGFSWSENPHPEIVRAYQQLGRAVELLARDGYSVDRLHAAGIEARLVPDTVFALPIQPEKPLPNDDHRRLNQPIAVLNISGLLRNRYELSEEYVAIIGELRRREYQILVVPHVYRHGDDDFAAAREITDRFTNDHGVRLVSTATQPDQVRALISEARMIITGRMHLAILGLTVGVPPIIFGTQGKVEGMLKLFGLENLAVSPGFGMAERTIETISYLESHYDNVHSTVAEKLPQVSLWSRLNFQ